MKIRKPKKRNKKAIIISAACAAVCLIAVAVAFRGPIMKLFTIAGDAALQKPYYKKYEDKDGRLVVWLDPGHGGADPGAVSAFLGEEVESSINMRLALLVKDKLEGCGYTVKMTVGEYVSEDENGKYTLPERMAAVNSDETADLFISLHCNAFTEPEVYGARLYYYKANSGYAHYFADSIADGIMQAHGEDKPRLFSMTKDEVYYVLKNCDVPAVLVETAFITNESDAKKLLDIEWLEREAQGIADGVHNFIK